MCKHVLTKSIVNSVSLIVSMITVKLIIELSPQVIEAIPVVR